MGRLVVAAVAVAFASLGVATMAGCSRVPEGCSPGGFGQSVLVTEARNSEDQQPRMSGTHAVVVKLDDSTFVVECTVALNAGVSCTSEMKDGFRVSAFIEETGVNPFFAYPKLADRPKRVEVSFFAGPDPAVDKLLANYAYEPTFEQDTADNGRICETAVPEEDEYTFSL